MIRLRYFAKIFKKLGDNNNSYFASVHYKQSLEVLINLAVGAKRKMDFEASGSNPTASSAAAPQTNNSQPLDTAVLKYLFNKVRKFQTLDPVVASFQAEHVEYRSKFDLVLEHPVAAGGKWPKIAVEACILQVANQEIGLALCAVEYIGVALLFPVFNKNDLILQDDLVKISDRIVLTCCECSKPKRLILEQSINGERTDFNTWRFKLGNLFPKAVEPLKVISVSNPLSAKRKVGSPKVQSGKDSIASVAEKAQNLRATTNITSNNAQKNSQNDILAQTTGLGISFPDFEPSLLDIPKLPTSVSMQRLSGMFDNRLTVTLTPPLSDELKGFMNTTTSSAEAEDVQNVKVVQHSDDEDSSLQNKHPVQADLLRARKIRKEIELEILAKERAQQQELRRQHHDNDDSEITSSGDDISKQEDDDDEEEDLKSIQSIITNEPESIVREDASSSSCTLVLDAPPPRPPPQQPTTTPPPPPVNSGPTSVPVFTSYPLTIPLPCISAYSSKPTTDNNYRYSEYEELQSKKSETSSSAPLTPPAQLLRPLKFESPIFLDDSSDEEPDNNNHINNPSNHKLRFVKIVSGRIKSLSHKIKHAPKTRKAPKRPESKLQTKQTPKFIPNTVSTQLLLSHTPPPSPQAVPSIPVFKDNTDTLQQLPPSPTNSICSHGTSFFHHERPETSKGDTLSQDKHQTQILEQPEKNIIINSSDDKHAETTIKDETSTAISATAIYCNSNNSTVETGSSYSNSFSSRSIKKSSSGGSRCTTASKSSSQNSGLCNYLLKDDEEEPLILNLDKFTNGEAEEEEEEEKEEVEQVEAEVKQASMPKSFSGSSLSKNGRVSLYKGTAYVSQWQGFRWVPLYKREVGIEVSVGGDGGMIVGYSNGQDQQVQMEMKLSSSHEVRKSTVLDVQITQTNHITMFRLRTLSEKDKFYEAVEASRREVTDQPLLYSMPRRLSYVPSMTSSISSWGSITSAIPGFPLSPTPPADSSNSSVFSFSSSSGSLRSPTINGHHQPLSAQKIIQASRSPKKVCNSPPITDGMMDAAGPQILLVNNLRCKWFTKTIDHHWEKRGILAQLSVLSIPNSTIKRVIVGTSVKTNSPVLYENMLTAKCFQRVGKVGISIRHDNTVDNASEILYMIQFKGDKEAGYINELLTSEI